MKIPCNITDIERLPQDRRRVRYIVELQNLRNGDLAQTEFYDTDSVTDFVGKVCAAIGVATLLDSDFFCITCNGRIYMPGTDIPDFVDRLWEGCDDPEDLEKQGDIYHEDSYTPLDDMLACDLFTVIGSACVYHCGFYHVRCTLLDREQLSDSPEEFYDNIPR